MKTRPILFSASIVRAILAGTKTQTLRIVKLKNGQYMPPSKRADINGWQQMLRLCPYGQRGDRLWVRENLRKMGDYMVYAADESIVECGELSWPSSIESRSSIPSIHMPRWASRITLEITGVRVERLQDISTSDALAEGVQHNPMNDPRVEYQWLWESINGIGSWDTNPWVWVVEFQRAQENGAA